jgi:hypothetical protein
MPAMTLRTGTTVRLKKQPAHYPAFVVMGCQGDRVWIRQPDWPTHLQLCVNVTQLAMPTPAPIPAWGPPAWAKAWKHPAAG